MKTKKTFGFKIAHLDDRYTSEFMVTGPQKHHPKGKNKRWRKYFPTKAEAEAYINGRVVDILNHGQEMARLPTAVLHDSVRGLEMIKNAGCPLTILACIQRGVDQWQREQKSCTLSELLERLEIHWKERIGLNKMTTRYANDQRRCWARFAAHVGIERNLAQIMPEEIEEFLAEIEVQVPGSPTKAKPSQKTLQHHFDTLQAGFRFAKRKRLIDANPAEPVDRPGVADYDPETFKPTEVKEFLEAVRQTDHRYLLYFTLSFFCGIRCSELLQLDQAQIDIRARQIQITKSQSKTNETRTVHLPPNARYWLRMSSFTGSGPLLAPVLKNDLSDFRKKALATLTIATGRSWRWPKNVARHSFATYHLAWHRKRAYTCEQTGHSAKMLRDHYAGEATFAQGKAYFRILPEGAILDKRDASKKGESAKYLHHDEPVRWPTFVKPPSPPKDGLESLPAEQAIQKSEKVEKNPRRSESSRDIIPSPTEAKPNQTLIPSPT